MLLNNDDGLYDLIHSVLDEDNITYDDEQLHYSCNKLQVLLKNNLVLLMDILGNQDNLKHVLYMHAPETAYVLLKDLKIN